MTIKLRSRNADIATVRPNWSSAVGVEYSFRTSIFESRDGTEQREALRQRPRIALKFTTALTQSGASRHQSDMANKQGALWAVRAEWAWVSLTVAHVSPGHEITVDEVPDWVKPGQQVIIETATHEDLATVSGKSGKKIILDNNTPRDYPKGTKVYLAYMSRAAASSDFTALTSGVWQGAVRYEVNPGEGAPLDSVPPAFSFAYSRMFLKKPNWREQPKISFVQERDVFDPGIGLIHVTSPHEAGVLRMQFGLTGLSREDSEEVVAFFNAMRGRQKSFWIPTWTDDIRPSDEQIGGANKIKIPGEDFRNSYLNHPVFQSVIVFYDTCGYQANTIKTITGTTDSEVAFENPWSQEINSRSRIYWLVKCRFDTDTLDVRWVTRDTAEAQFSVRTLPHTLVPDWPIPPKFDQLAKTGGTESYSVQEWGTLPVKTASPTKISKVINLTDMGITPEQIEAGEVVVFSRMAGTYREGTPLAGSETTFLMDIVFHTKKPDYYYDSVVTPNPGSVTSKSLFQGPAMDIELAPVVVPPTTRWVQFRAAYVDAVTSNLELSESTWGVGRPETASFKGTSLARFC